MCFPWKQWSPSYIVDSNSRQQQSTAWHQCQPDHQGYSRLAVLSSPQGSDRNTGCWYLTILQRQIRNEILLTIWKFRSYVGKAWSEHQLEYDPWISPPSKHGNLILKFVAVECTPEVIWMSVASTRISIQSVGLLSDTRVRNYGGRELPAIGRISETQFCQSMDSFQSK